MAGKGIKAGGTVTDLSKARKAKDAASDRKDDGGPKNNLQAIREQEEAQLLSVLAQMRPALARVEEAKAVVKERVADVDAILDKAVVQGFKKGEIRELLKETAVKGSRKDQQAVEERRLRFREYVGLPTGVVQPDLLDAPEAAKDEIGWELEGYKAGVLAEEPKPPQKCPERYHQAWLTGYHNGQARNAWAMSGGKGAPPKPAAVQPEPTRHPEAGVGTAGDTPVVAPEGPATAENFEASEAELAAQTSRPSTIESTDPAPAGEAAADAPAPVESPDAV